MVGGSVLLIACNIQSMYGSFLTSLRHAFFQVSSIISTTGFSSVDFDLWPEFSRALLVILMFCGGLRRLYRRRRKVLPGPASL